MAKSLDPDDVKSDLVRSSGVRVPITSYTRFRLASWDLPAWSWTQCYRMIWVEPTVRIGLGYILAPIEQMQVLQPDEQPLPANYYLRVESEDDEVAAFVAKNLQRLWSQDLHLILKAIAHGFSTSEVEYEIRDGEIAYRRLVWWPPETVRILTYKKSGRIAGIKIDRNQGVSKTGEIKTRGKFLHVIYRADEDPYYGLSHLFGAHVPFLELHGEDGATENRRVWYYKCASLAHMIRYPEGTVTLADGRKLQAIDYAREVIDALATNGSVQLPNTKDSNGKPEWELESPQMFGNGQMFIEHCEYLESRILKAMEISPEVIEAQESTGALAGRRVPQLMFYQSLNKHVRMVCSAIKKQILEWMVFAEFGKNAADFEIKPDNLLPNPQAQQAAMQASAPMGPAGGMPGPGGGGNPLAALLGGGG